MRIRRKPEIEAELPSATKRHKRSRFDALNALRKSQSLPLIAVVASPKHCCPRVPETCRMSGCLKGSWKGL